jgi:hypothetical protein
LNFLCQTLTICLNITAPGPHKWKGGQKLSVLGWIYALNDGLIRDLQMSVGNPDETVGACRTAVAAVRLRSSR